MTEAESMKSWTREIEPYKVRFGHKDVWIEAESDQFDRKHVRTSDDRWFVPEALTAV